ncbi:MAG: hypothetical protein LBK23_07050 [Oscillospiraceae bacterium]|jgi:hypothetical protein|nr:hypothetical protein [Oscillospiraceae bacterium]
MKLNELFKKTNSCWAKYDAYEWREYGGKLFLLPAERAQVAVYDPIKLADELIVDAINVGMQCMYDQTEDAIREHIFSFVTKYGLLGLMTSLPLAFDFTDYATVYLPVNYVTKARTLPTNEYVSLFFPFDKPDFDKDAKCGVYNIRRDHMDKQQAALYLTFAETSMAMALVVRRGYGEQYEWLANTFASWAYSFFASEFFYSGSEDETDRELHRQAMKAFACNTPQYRIRLYDDKPTIV